MIDSINIKDDWLKSLFGFENLNLELELRLVCEFESSLKF